MYIAFSTKKLQKRCEKFDEAVRVWGTVRAKKIFRRLGEIKAAANMKELRQLPGPRCHLLSHQLKGLYSLDLDGPYRLIVEPILKCNTDSLTGEVDESHIEGVTVIKVKDTHG